MRAWLSKISSKFKGDEDAINVISPEDAEIVDTVIDILDEIGEYGMELHKILTAYKQVNDAKTLTSLKSLLNEFKSDGKHKFFVSINGTIITVRDIKTIKEYCEYDFSNNKQKYYIIINEAPETNPSPYANVKILCNSEAHRIQLMTNLNHYLNKFKIKIENI